MELPKDPMMLFSVVNMKLRDFYPSLDALCEDLHVSKDDIVNRLKEAGLQMAVSETAKAAVSDRLAGKSIVISGVFEHHSRDEYKKLIELNGGKNTSSISKKTDFVFAGANMGPSKLEKAKALGIPVVNEDEFLKMIEQ